MNDSKKIFTTNRTKFKLVIYWNLKPDGTPYSVFEKQRRMNRKYIYSYDYTDVGGYNTTDHRLAMNKLLDKMKRQKDAIDKAFLIMNDWENNKELTIGDFPNGDKEQGNFVHPCFSKPNEKGHRYVHSLPREPLRIDEMREQTLIYKKGTKQ